MANLNENYYLRKCFLDKNEVPNQSLIKKKMGALAHVFFKSMSRQDKILSGLEPPLKGGGKDWYIPPMEILKGRAVVKPVERKYLSKLSCDGLSDVGEKLAEDYLRRLELEKQKLLLQSDLNWKKIIVTECDREGNAIAADAKKQNTSKIKQDYEEFTVIYRTSVTRIESLLYSAGTKEMQRVKGRALREISTNFKILLNEQSKLINNEYKQKLETKKSDIKDTFIKYLQEFHIIRNKELQDIRYEKHVAVEKIRTLLEYQNLACQVYVALKEQVECNKYLYDAKRKHEHAMRKMSEKIAKKEIKINLAREIQNKQDECKRIWQKKICIVVKRFQQFVKYCLKTVPDHADYFINMEKLMLLHLGDTLENPSVESIFVSDDDENSDETPPPHPDPFYLICDEGFKPEIDSSLNPNRCTCSAAQLPVVVVNKKCMYSACNNFDLFIDKVKEFIDGKRGNDNSFMDDHDYTNDVPIECKSSEELRQLQMESSWMQILQNTNANVKQVPNKCKICNSFYCFCTPMESKTHSEHKLQEIEPYEYHEPSKQKITLRTDELKHMREPKIDAYLKYTLPTDCECALMRKKQLHEKLPPYMRNVSKYETVNIPKYEICNLNKLKSLINNSGKIKPEKVISAIEEKFKDASTQYSDHEYDDLCQWLENVNFPCKFKEVDSTKIDDKKSQPFKVFREPFSWSNLEKQTSYFAFETALQLKQIIRETPDLEELFKKEDCNSLDKNK